MLLLVVIFFSLFLFSFYIPKKQSNAHGSATIQKTAKNLGYFNKGVKVGVKAMSKSDSTHNILLLGVSGSGKTQKVLLHNIFHLAKNSWSQVILDPKGELLELTSGYLQGKLNLEVYVLDLINPEKSISYNPFSRIKEQEIQGLITDMYDMANANKPSEAIWKYGCIEVIVLCCKILFYYNQRKYFNLSNLLYLLQYIQSDPEKMQDWLEENTSEPSLLHGIRRFFSQETKVFHGIMSCATSVIIPFIPDEIKSISQTTSLPGINTFRKKQSVLYICYPIGRVSATMPYVTLLLKELFTTVVNTPVTPNDKFIGFILEEFGQLFPIPDYASIVATIRSRKAFLFHCLQNLDQLSYRYGNDVANIIANNSAHWLILSGSKSEKTNSYIAETLTGRGTHQKKSDGKTIEFGRPVFFKDEIRRLPKEFALFVSTNLPVAMIKLQAIYKSWFKKWRFGLVSTKGMLRSTYPHVEHQEYRPSVEYMDFEEQKLIIQDDQPSFEEKLNKLLPKDEELS